MTSITRSLPWFIKDLGVGIIGKECYTTLVENLDITDVPCLKYSLSKGLGIAIVVGGTVMKVPQILLITNARSARGLSLPASVLETLSYAITSVYSFRHAFPFSTYGENLFLTLQNTLILFLIIGYAPPPLNPSMSTLGKPERLVSAVAGCIVTTAILMTSDNEALSWLQAATLPLSLFSKLPQIAENYRAGSTGQLSAIAVLSQVLGCAARLFTTATETGDALVQAGFILALMLNLVLGAQMYAYWGNDGAAGAKKEAEKVAVAEKRIAASITPASDDLRKRTETASGPAAPVPSYPVSYAAATDPVSPPARATTPGGGRKWARKVD
ncbi:hypothetical protein D9619_012528 [Psilocybe cf. subviscida]|uniref:Mannose-P-dolichol utilization defect 1 protein homolog n=1 Tax=Psilocybe cf. subviscida TaxID=2480587 RepID=A0A8H5B7Q0_9AGAR|nr:hypothetical protein D9619_012528 [Psilocybe cf. subviscida]